MLIIKPDAFERVLVGVILARFENRDIAPCKPFKRMYSGRMTTQHCREHYRDHIGKPYFGALVNHMISGISLFIDTELPWDEAREIAMLIRNNYKTEGPRNLIHASDSQESDESETAYWFKDYPL